MAKAKRAYVCNDCGADFPRWQGQCNSCSSWNTISEVKLAAVSSVSKSVSNSTPSGYAGSTGKGARKVSEIETTVVNRMKTGQPELDRVLGGMLTVGSVVLVSGDPGAGKTTLLSQVIAYASQSMMTMYVTAEESLEQWTTRAVDRLKLDYVNDNLLLDDEDVVENIVSKALANGVKLLIADSIQAFTSCESEGTAGGVTQVKACAAILNRLCKTHGITLLLVGQVNKNSQMAGPQVLKHIVDTTIHIEVTEGAVRFLRSDKNRFGDTDQVGIFQMTGERGMVSVSNPSRLFLSNSDEKYSGTAICVIRDGARNMLLEVQSLVTDVEGEKAMRNCIGVSYSRLSLITQVLKKHGGIKTFKDINVSLVGGIKLPDTETSTDLAVAASFISSSEEKIIPDDSVFIGEVALTGEIRQVRDGISRVKECLQYGKKKIYVPKANFCKQMKALNNGDQQVIALKDVKELIEVIV